MNNEAAKKAIFDACLRAVTEISEDAKGLLQAAHDRETSPAAKSMMKSMLDNLEIAKAQDKAVCQSPGYPTTWISFGDDNFPHYAKQTICDALGEATKRGYLRPSIVDPLTRHNPGNNTGEGVPNIEYQYNPGQEYVDFVISFKGCGAELGNAMKIFTTATLEMGNMDETGFTGLKRFLLETVIAAGGKPCPPYAIGIGIGGQMDIASKLSREAISTRKWDDENPDPLLNAMEKELLENVNAMKLGAAGIGGDTSCLAIKIGRAATHTAIAPVAINFHCWVARRAGIRIWNDGRIEKIL